MGKKLVVIVSLTAGLFMVGMINMTQAAMVITSTFDNDANDWWITEIFNDGTVSSGQWNTSWSATEGLPGGSIYTSDVGSGGTVFSAPAKFLGDKIGYLGGTISFDMRNSVANYDGGPTYYNLFLFGGGMMITHKGAYPTVAYQWVHDDTALDFQSWTYAEGSWTTPVSTADFSTVLGSLEGIYIQTDWGWGPDTGWLDNVTMALANPVPEPTTALLLGSGVVALAGMKLSKKKR